MASGIFEDIAIRLKNKLPNGVHDKIECILNEIEEDDKICGELSDLIIRKPIINIISRLENNEVKSIQVMKFLQNQLSWSHLFAEGIKDGLDCSQYMSEELLDKIWSTYLHETSMGKQVKLKDLLLITKFNNKGLNDTDEKKPEYHDITTSNVIFMLSEIIEDIESKFMEILPNYFMFLKNGEYNKIDLSVFGFDGGVADEYSEFDEYSRTSQPSPTNTINSKKQNIIRYIELHKMFKPLLKAAHTFVSIIPVVQMMLFDEKDGIDKIRDDCNRIINEFSFGANLERIAISLKHKYVNNHEISELKINADSIKKIFQKLINDLNIGVLTQLRRLRISTIIEDGLFQDAKEIGIDFTSLNSQFGNTTVPPKYNDIKFEATRVFSLAVSEFSKITKNRITEENTTKYNPNLRMLNELINEVKNTIEGNSMVIPIHISPIFGGTIKLMTDQINYLNSILNPLRDISLQLYLRDESFRDEFYSRLGESYQNIMNAYYTYCDFISLGMKLVDADKNLAVKFCEMAGTGDKTQFEQKYSDLIDKSIKNLNRMRQMKTLSIEDAKKIQEKIEIAKENIEAFTQSWDPQAVSDILSEAYNLL